MLFSKTSLPSDPFLSLLYSLFWLVGGMTSRREHSLAVCYWCQLELQALVSVRLKGGCGIGRRNWPSLVDHPQAFAHEENLKKIINKQLWIWRTSKMLFFAKLTVFVGQRVRAYVCDWIGKELVKEGQVQRPYLWEYSWMTSYSLQLPITINQSIIALTMVRVLE